MFKNFRCSGFFRAIVAVSMISALAACGGSNDGVGVASAAKAQIKAVKADQQDCSPDLDPTQSFSAVLAQPLYSISGYLSVRNTAPPAPITFNHTYVVRDNWVLSGNTLTTTQDYLPTSSSTVWTPAPTGVFDIDQAKYLMKADGTWTDLLTSAQLHPAYQGSVVCGDFVATDPNTNINWTISYQQGVGLDKFDLTNKLFSKALSSSPTSTPFPGSAMTGSFPSGATGWAPLQYSSDSDSFYIPTWDTNIDSATDASTYYTDGGTRVWNAIGGPATTYTSIQQVFGLKIPTEPGPNGPGSWIVLSADGTGQQWQKNGTQAPFVVTNLQITWAPYVNNSDVLVMNINNTTSANPPWDSRLTQAVFSQAGKLAVALRGGHLQLAIETQPAKRAIVGEGVPGIQLTQDLFDLVTASYTAAIRSFGFQ